MNECFYAMYKTSLRFAAAWETSENSLLIYFHIPFRFGCRPREASRLEAKTHEAEAKTHEAEAEAEATTHEAEAEARFFRPRGRGQASRPNIPGSLYKFGRTKHCSVRYKTANARTSHCSRKRNLEI